MGDKEVAVGGGAAPGVADGTAVKEGFGGQANEDLKHEDLILEAMEETC